LLDLVFKSLLVVLILLLVLTTDDLLSLLRNSVELDVLGSLNQILDEQGVSLNLSLDLFELSLRVEDLLHVFNLTVSSLLDLFVLEVEVSSVDENSILVVSCDWKLRNLNLSLLEVDNNLEVELELLRSILSLLEL